MKKINVKDNGEVDLAVLELLRADDRHHPRAKVMKDLGLNPAKHDRVLDRSLQRLRKQELVAYSPGAGWCALPPWALKKVRHG